MKGIIMYVDDPSAKLGKAFITDKPHKFFHRDLDLDLEQVKEDLFVEYDRIETGKMHGVTPFNWSHPELEFFKESNSISTIKSREYNAWQMYYPWIHEMFSAVVDMTREACAYYDFDYNDEQWVVQSWFNINSRQKGGKLDFHDHINPGDKFLAFHGYYAVSAEPSETHYMVDGNMVINHNKNNRVIMSKSGYKHAMAPWDWDGPRITIAYDVLPLGVVEQKQFVHKRLEETGEHFWEQHFFPLPKIY